MAIARKAAAPQAFVISPIGGIEQGERDARRDYADKVFDKIIGSAVEALRREGRSIEPIRGDHEPHKGDIIRRIIDNVTEAEIVIAVLSEADCATSNGNVYYELGIAHYAGRPAILLKHRDQPDIFDLRGKEMILFEDGHLDGGLDPMGEHGPARKLAEQMKRLLDFDELFQPPFDKQADEGIAVGRLGARDRFRSISYEDWSYMILDAREEIWIAGTTLMQLADFGNTSFFAPDDDGALTVPVHINDLLAIQIAQGRDVTILLTHPEHPLLDSLYPDEADGPVTEMRRKQLRDEAESAFALWRSLKHKAEKFVETEQEAAARGERGDSAPPDVPPGRFRVIQVRRGAVLHRMFLTDRRLVLTPNFISLGFNSGPCVEARNNTLWHRKARDDLAMLASLNEGSDPSDVAASGASGRASSNGSEPRRLFGLLGRRREA